MLQVCCIILSPLCSRYSFTVFTYLIFEVVTIFQSWMQYWYMIYHELHSFYFLFPKCARGKECESIVIHIQHFVFKDCAWKFLKLNNKFGFLWLFYKMQVLQICKHSLHVNICLSWWAVVSCMCFVSDLQENEEKFTLFGLIFPQSKNNIYSVNCIKPCICIINGGLQHPGYQK